MATTNYLQKKHWGPFRKGKKVWHDEIWKMTKKKEDKVFKAQTVWWLTEWLTHLWKTDDWLWPNSDWPCLSDEDWEKFEQNKQKTKITISWAPVGSQ